MDFVIGLLLSRAHTNVRDSTLFHHREIILKEGLAVFDAPGTFLSCEY